VPKRLEQFEVPEGEQTVRVVFPDGRSFRVGVRDGGGVRFEIEKSNAQITEFYGRGKPDDDGIIGKEILAPAVKVE
jgi:hypothetical protein